MITDGSPTNRVAIERIVALQSTLRRTSFCHNQQSWLALGLSMQQLEALVVLYVASAQTVSECRWPARMESIARPVMYGISTVIPIAPKASANDHATDAR